MLPLHTINNFNVCYVVDGGAPVTLAWLGKNGPNT